jgi:hypothetical protein
MASNLALFKGFKNIIYSMAYGAVRSIYYDNAKDEKIYTYKVGYMLFNSFSHITLYPLAIIEDTINLLITNNKHSYLLFPITKLLK